jgi:two-component system OmpR family response regulator
MPVMRRAGGVSARSSSTWRRAPPAWPGSAVELTAREWALVEALVQRAGRIVTKSRPGAAAAGRRRRAVQSNALEVHVSSVRRKLGRDLIETVRGLGYRVRSGHVV